MISSQMYTKQLVQIKTASIEAAYFKSEVSQIQSVQSIQDCQIQVASFCTLIDTTCNQVITQKVLDFLNIFQKFNPIFNIKI